ncbi:TPA: hypothetical protein DEW47_01150 [Patescibacteria group bacterium]|nr:MAG: Radical SAM domain protein [Parcubacteria group bacterium GW2011_GWF2_40_10]KKR47325.1 MAG: Radical SAM domain protein [Parcubacteria group bacterium GW2011_GWA2_40_143]KKR59967.1 MAG: Radical SAM domain protein [Parcubacteria group bacterium GW2011_GWC2_40_31]KKR74611.1 MAG: Radical SAM domain protein [Parcubacteria group bacterium GW2011_GWB2_40_8]KKR83067.1 MAG: Radical SAM domain protein [Parcubacteria group bacterium GW2011_GWD2_40_9]HBB56815.1 hypothetical protein [Patescibacteri
MKYKFSKFCLYLIDENRVVIKNTRTGAIVVMSKKTFLRIKKWIQGSESSLPQQCLANLSGENGILVSNDLDEFEDYKKSFLFTRNKKANLFSLHFLPTTNCQFSCNYCFEKGTSKTDMNFNILGQSIKWLYQYLDINKAIDDLRLIIFGGEPLLRKDLVTTFLPEFKRLSEIYKKSFWTELTTNGEFLNQDVAKTLANYNWKRAQITLDGYGETHDRRRTNANRKLSFHQIISNIKMLIENNYIDKIDLRISLDGETYDSIPKLIKFLGKLGWQEKIKLSLGLIVPGINVDVKKDSQKLTAERVLNVWVIAKKEGFEIPDEFMAGPWCVAIAKHSAVLQPDGTLQKCFCTVGKPEFNFNNIFSKPLSYTKDDRFEMFDRINKCIEEECVYLPICGGGCIHDSIVAYGKVGFKRRFCQKTLLGKINLGLLKLNFR